MVERETVLAHQNEGLGSLGNRGSQPGVQVPPLSTHRMYCPRCGRPNVTPHSKRTFIPDGFTCWDCTAIFYPKNVQMKLTQLSRLRRRQTRR